MISHSLLAKLRPCPYTISMQKELDTQKHPMLFLIPVAISLFFIAFGLYLIRSDKARAARCTEQVTGVVAEMQESERDRTLTAPVFEYSYDGQDFRQESNSYSYPPAFSTGEQVTIMVNPDDPDDYFVASHKTNATMARVFIIIGLVIAGFFLFYIVHVLLEKRDTARGKEPKGIRVGVIFILIGLFSAAIPIRILQLKDGSRDFFYITTTANGIQTSEYNPIFSIAMLAFCFLFALAFIILGIVMIQKKSLSFSVEAEISAEMDENGNVTGISSSGSSAAVLPKVFAAVGLLLLTIGVGLLAYDRSSLKSLIRTEAAVTGTYTQGTKKHRTYYASIKYRVDGQDYQSQITVSPFFNKFHVTVWCRPDNPLVCRTKLEFLIFYIVLFGVGGSFFAGSFILGQATKKNDRLN